MHGCFPANFGLAYRISQRFEAELTLIAYTSRYASIAIYTYGSYMLNSARASQQQVSNLHLILSGLAVAVTCKAFRAWSLL